MRAMSWGVVAVAMALLAGPSVASACAVKGRVICQQTNENDPVVALDKVGLTFTSVTYGSITYQASTNGDGEYSFYIPGEGCPGYWDTSLNLSLLGGGSNVTGPDIYTDFLGIDIPWVVPDIKLTGAELSICGSQCDISAVPEGRLACMERPLGNPRAECAHFGDFVPVGDGWNTDGSSIYATVAADFAIVKSGRACYAITKNVSIGDLLTAPAEFGVSHVTYCGCAPK